MVCLRVQLPFPKTTLQVALSWWFGLVVWEFEPLVLVEGKTHLEPLNHWAPNHLLEGS